MHKNERGELVRRILFMPEDRNAQLIKEGVPNFVQEHLRQRTQNGVLGRHARGRGRFGRELAHLLHVLVANRHREILRRVPGVVVAVAAGEPQHEDAWQTNHAQEHA